MISYIEINEQQKTYIENNLEESFNETFEVMSVSNYGEEYRIFFRTEKGNGSIFAKFHLLDNKIEDFEITN